MVRQLRTSHFSRISSNLLTRYTNKGDVPGLDFARESSYPVVLTGRRNSANSLAKTLQYAFVIGAIAACLMHIREANALGVNAWIESERIASDKNLPTESCYTSRRVGQYVGISRPTPQIKKFSVSLNIQNILWSNGGTGKMRSLTASARHFWPQQSRSWWGSGISISKIKRGGHPRIAEEAVSIDLHSPSWCISAVLPNGSKPPIELASISWFVKGQQSFRENEGTLIGDKSFSSELRLLASSEPQRAGESGNYKSSERRNTYAVAFDKTSGTGNIRSENGSVTGWLVFGGGIGIGVLLVIYAALKEWRRGTFNSHKNRQQNNDQG